MMEFPLPPLNIGLSGLVTLTIILILWGKLVPFAFYKREVERNDVLVKTNESLSAALTDLAAQVQKVYDGNELILTAIKDGHIATRKQHEVS